MIRAVIFDLDGTLVQTESIKALSYARAAVALSPNSVSEEQVIESFKEVVGLSRHEVAVKLLDHLKLKDVAASKVEEFGVSEPWQAFLQITL